jgi:hypothetical protein
MADAESFLREHVNPLARIKGNVAKMVAQGAPESDIDGYIASEGVTLDGRRAAFAAAAAFRARPGARG